MAKTIQQIQAMITGKSDAREVINEIADYLEANPGGAGGVQSIIAGTNITLGGTAADPVINASGGSSLVLSETVTLTDAQIKALPTTPIQIVAAPGANKYIKYAGAVLVLDVTSGVYTNLNTSAMNLLRTGQNPLTVDFSGAYLEDDSNVWVYQDTSVNNDGIPVVLSELENLAIEISSQNTGNLTGGNAANTLKVTVYYVVVDI